METLNKDLTPYPAYKDSAIPWLGQIPAHWDLVRNKTLFSRRREVVGNRHSEYTLLSLTLQGIIPRDMEQAKGKFPADFSTYQVVEEEDFVFCLFDMDETPRTIGIAPLSGMITGAYTVFTPKSVEPKFLYYLYLSLDDRKALKPLYTGLRKVIPEDRFLQTKTPLPPPDEQAAIARYLDAVDRRIRRYIRAKQKLIKLLEEQKQAIIHQAVTRGLDPNVPLKDAGVEWLGQVPAHWTNARLKDLAVVQTGMTLGKNYFGIETKSYPYLRVANVQHGRLDLRQVKHIDLPENEAVGCTLRDGDVLMTEGGDIDKLGRGCVWRDEISGCLHQNHVFAVRCRQSVLIPEFLVALMTSQHGRAYFQLTAKQTTNLASTNSTTLRAFPIILPPIDEQKTILEEIRTSTSGIDSAIGRMSSEIDLIREYRTRLIADVVTGQVDVRRAAASWAVGDVAVEESVLDEGWADDDAEDEMDDAVLEGEE